MLEPKPEFATPELVAVKGGTSIIRADVSKQSAVEDMVASTVDVFGNLELFVSNAVYSDRELFVDANLDGFRRTIDVTMWARFSASAPRPDR